MAKRGYRGKHPNNDMKVAPTEDKVANKNKITKEYDKIKAKNKYDFIKSHDGFFPRASGEIVCGGSIGAGNTIIITSTDGTTQTYEAAGAEDLEATPCEFARTGAAAAATSLQNCMEAPPTPGTVTIAVADADLLAEGKKLTIVDTAGTSHVFTFTLLNNLTADNSIGVLACQGGDDEDDCATQIVAAINAGTCADTITAVAATANVNLTQDVDGASGNAINSYDGAGLTMANFTGGGVNSHLGKISVSKDTATLTLSQVEPGPHGNTTMTSTLAGGSKTDFTGG